MASRCAASIADLMYQVPSEAILPRGDYTVLREEVHDTAVDNCFHCLGENAEERHRAIVAQV